MAGGLAQVRAGFQQAVAHLAARQHFPHCFWACLLSLRDKACMKLRLHINSAYPRVHHLRMTDIQLCN